MKKKNKEVTLGEYELFVNNIVDRFSGYGDSSTLDGRIGATLAILIDLSFILYKRKLLDKTDLELLAEKYPKLEKYGELN